MKSKTIREIDEKNRRWKLFVAVWFLCAFLSFMLALFGGDPYGKILFCLVLAGLWKLTPKYALYGAFIVLCAILIEFFLFFAGMRAY